MSAHDVFEKVVGEIGYNRNEFLLQLRWWEILSIVDGYHARQHGLWESARLNAFLVMSATADLRKAGVTSDRALVRFPWEDDDVASEDQPDAEEVERLRQLMREENERLWKRTSE